MVTVYTNPNCVQCDQTKRFLDRVGIQYTIVNFIDDQEALKKFVDLGYKSAPVVVTEKDTWSGFKIDKLNKLVEDSL